MSCERSPSSEAFNTRITLKNYTTMKIEIKQTLDGYTCISCNGIEIAKHCLSPTTQGTREAFDIPEDESVIQWIETHFKNEIEEILNN